MPKVCLCGHSKSFHTWYGCLLCECDDYLEIYEPNGNDGLTPDERKYLEYDSTEEYLASRGL